MHHLSLSHVLNLNVIWFLLVGILFTGYAILDGFDFGVGILHLFVKRMRTAESCSTPSVRFGMAMRSGSSQVEAPSLPRSPVPTPPSFPASTMPLCCYWWR